MERSKFGYDWQHVFGVLSHSSADDVAKWKCKNIFEDKDDATVILVFELSEDVVDKRLKQVDTVRVELRKAQRFPVIFYNAGFGGEQPPPYPISGTVADSAPSGAELIRNLLQYAWSWECPF